MSTEQKEQKKYVSYTDRLIEHVRKECHMTVMSEQLDRVIVEIEAFALAQSKLISERENKGCMTFGKHKDKLLTDVAKFDPSYVTWLKKNDNYLNSDLKLILKEL
jgi:aminoglycoside phosphotransferase family enzyme